jgi:hypothetical protein
MVKRCFDPKSNNYKNYGKRGITVEDERWLEFVNFYEDMGERPKGMTLDRKDNNKGYCKENCRWAINEDQENNRRNNHLLTFNGKTQSMAKWARELGMTYSTIMSRVRKNWPLDKVFKH